MVVIYVNHIENAIETKLNSEKEIQKIMKQILEGLSFLHRHNVAHLDLKPDNIMFDNKNNIQLIDFGMSRMIPPLQKAGVLVGTPNFVAPEVIRGFYDKKADVWSVGVIFFMLRFGYPPFFENDININKNHSIASTIDLKEEDSAFEVNKRLFNKIKAGFNPIVKDGLGAWFPSNTKISLNLKDLISKMLETDLSKRLTIAECLSHNYFREIFDDTKLPPTIMNALTSFSGQCKFKVLISRLFAHQIDPDQFKALKEIWDEFDIDHDGSLTMLQFKKVMSKYNHGYKDYQIEAMFESLDWNEKETINFNSILTAYSYQRLVAVDERLWEAFAKLDVDNDGHITKAEIKRVLAMINPSEYNIGLNLIKNTKSIINLNAGLSKLNLSENEKKKRRDKNLSVFIGECMVSADWDDDGQIDYEEFLRALHPRFNEDPVTPKEYSTNNTDININEETTTDGKPKFLFPQSLDMYVDNNNENSENTKKQYDEYHKNKQNELNDDEQIIKAQSLNTDDAKKPPLNDFVSN